MFLEVDRALFTTTRYRIISHINPALTNAQWGLQINATEALRIRLRRALPWITRLSLYSTTIFGSSSLASTRGGDGG